MPQIELKGMLFLAHHGYHEEERKTGGKFIVDLLIHTGNLPAEQTDDLNDTLDYAEVYEVVREEMSVPSDLLEHVGRRIMNRVMATFPEIKSAEINVSKLSPPLGGPTERVSVRLSSGAL